MEPDEIHLRVVRELGEVIVRLFSVNCQWYWRCAEFPVNWKLADVTPQKGQEKILVIICLPVLFWCLVKLQRLFCKVFKNSRKTVQSCVEAVMAIWRKNHALLTENPIMTVTFLLDRGKIVDELLNVVGFFHFNKALDNVSHSILQDKMSSTQIDIYTPKWVNNWL